MLTQEPTTEPLGSGPLSVELWFEAPAPALDLSAVAHEAASLLGDVHAAEDGHLLALIGQQQALGLGAPVAYLASDPTARTPDQPVMSELERTQLWRIKGREDELLAHCGSSIGLVEMLGRQLDPPVRVHTLGAITSAAVRVCRPMAVRFPHSGDVYEPGQLAELAEEPTRFAQLAFNARFFNVAGGDGDGLTDTHGLYALGLPDVQVHFRDLDIDSTVGFAADVGLYLLANGDVIEDGHTVGGDGWRCQHEMSLIQPSREVLDLHAGDHAAGNRT